MYFLLAFSFFVSACARASLDPHIGVLVRRDGDKLRLREGESLHSSWLAGVLRAILVHFHHMEPGLVLVERLQNHHLQFQIKARASNSLLK